MDITKKLFSMQDMGYRDFQAALMPTVPKEKIIGIRVPLLRKFAKEIEGTKMADDFLRTLPHTYYEEDNLHAFLVSRCADFDSAIIKTEQFLPFIDNWSTCDMFFPKAFAQKPLQLLPHLNRWMKSEKEYTTRFAIGMYMRLFLDTYFEEEYAARIAKIQSEAYYVKMMIAWYFATALAKQYSRILPFFTNHHLPERTHNKAIQKAIESNRIPLETKIYLKTLKR